MQISKSQIAALIDHSLLKPFETGEAIQRICSEAREHRLKAVCVNPIHVAYAASCLQGASVLVCSVVGFPFGTHFSEIKAAEAREVIRAGAREVDMVINIGALKEGRDSDVLGDIRSVVDSAEGFPVKVILETCYLTDEEKVRGCLLAKQAGAAFVKTSTGFGTGGATEADIKLMRKAVGDDMGVKASGGIHTFDDAVKMIKAGARRLGASNSVSIVT